MNVKDRIISKECTCPGCGWSMPFTIFNKPSLSGHSVDCPWVKKERMKAKGKSNG